MPSSPTTSSITDRVFTLSRPKYTVNSKNRRNSNDNNNNGNNNNGNNYNNNTEEPRGRRTQHHPYDAHEEGQISHSVGGPHTARARGNGREEWRDIAGSRPRYGNRPVRTPDIRRNSYVGKPRAQRRPGHTPQPPLARRSPPRTPPPPPPPPPLRTAGGPPRPRHAPGHDCDCATAVHTQMGKIKTLIHDVRRISDWQTECNTHLRAIRDVVDKLHVLTKDSAQLAARARNKPQRSPRRVHQHRDVEVINVPPQPTSPGSWCEDVQSLASSPQSPSSD